MTYEDLAYKYSMGNYTEHGIKVGDWVIYRGFRCKVSKVDRHAHPVCLEGFGRVDINDVKCHNE